MLKRFFARNRRCPDFYGSKFDGFSDRRPLHSKFEGTKPPKRHVYQLEHDLWVIKRAIRTEIATCGLTEETEKNKKGGRRKSQNRYISPPRGGAILQPIFTKFGGFVDLTDVITPAKFGYNIFIVFFRPRGWKSHFPYRKAYGLYNSAMRYRAGLWFKVSFSNKESTLFVWPTNVVCLAAMLQVYTVVNRDRCNWFVTPYSGVFYISLYTYLCMESIWSIGD